MKTDRFYRICSLFCNTSIATIPLLTFLMDPNWNRQTKFKDDSWKNYRNAFVLFCRKIAFSFATTCVGRSLLGSKDIWRFRRFRIKQHRVPSFLIRNPIDCYIFHLFSSRQYHNYDPKSPLISISLLKFSGCVCKLSTSF